MGGQLDLHSEPGEGTTFFFTIEFEEIEAFHESFKGAFSNINALVLESTHKSKRQDIYLREYLDFYNVNYTTFKDKNELEILQKQLTYDLLFIDYEYSNEDEIQGYCKMPEEVILLTKSYFMKKIDSMDLAIFKTLYEPLTNTKIKSVLENYNDDNLKARKAEGEKRRKFDAKTSKFNANVLIAEDNIINQKLIKRTLEDLGLNVSLASNGLEAFQKRKDGNFDLIFMDIQMPFLDGMEATKEILEYETNYNQAHVPIIALTANALKGDRERFLRAGLDEYTTKPLIRTEIITLLNHFLSDHIIDVDKISYEESKNIEVDVPKTEEAQSDTPTIVEEDTYDGSQSIEVDKKKKEYAADILLAKNSTFETKLFTKLLDTMGYTYENVSNAENLTMKLNSSFYKVILFDKECDGLKLEEFISFIKEKDNENNTKTALIIIIDSNTNEENINSLEVDGVMKNIVNREKFQSLLQNFIKG